MPARQYDTPADRLRAWRARNRARSREHNRNGWIKRAELSVFHYDLDMDWRPPPEVLERRDRRIAAMVRYLASATPNEYYIGDPVAKLISVSSTELEAMQIHAV